MIVTPDCGKVPYPNPVTAWRVIRALTRQTMPLGHKKLCKRYMAYHCPDCHRWHLTHHSRDRPADWSQRRVALYERETLV